MKPNFQIPFDSIAFRLPSLADNTMPTLAIRYSLAPRAGELPEAQPTRATITISPTGGTGSKLRITIKQYQIDTTGTETVGTTTNIDGANYPTMKDVLKALNDIPGITAWILHAPYSYSTNSDDFIALPETDIRADGKYLETLYRDASEVTSAYLRMGTPQVWDKGRLIIRAIRGSCTGVTNGTVKLLRDEPNVQVEHMKFTLVATQTNYLDQDLNEASPYEGSLLLEIASDNLTAVDFTVQATQADI